jgi:hypothetical protein
LARPLTPQSLPWRKLVELHQDRHPNRGRQRVEAEVQSFLRRACRLGPDSRTPADGGLAGLTSDNAADAFLLVIRNTTDMTELYREAKA